MIRCDNLRGTAGNFELGPVNLRLSESITAVIGPNGAGKSTFIETLLGGRRVTGRVDFNSVEIRRDSLEAFRYVSYVSDSFPEMFLNMTAEEYLLFLSSVRKRQFGLDVADQLEVALDYLERFGQSLKGGRVKTYSLGMRRKLQLVGGLMHHPKLLVVDEPQTGLDFRSSSVFRSILSDLTQVEGRQVIMSNHDLDSVARSADRVLALHDGRITADLLTSSFTDTSELERELENAFRIES